MELVDELIDAVEVDSRPDAKSVRAHFEPGRAWRLARQPEPAPEGVVDNSLETLAAPAYLPGEALGDIAVECQGGSHESIMMSGQSDVKMRAPATRRQFLGARYRSPDTRTLE